MNSKETASQGALKQTAKNNLKTQYSMAKWISSLGIIAINDDTTREFVIRWLSDVWIWAVVLWSEKDYSLANIVWVGKLNSNSLIGFDFFVYDNEFEWVDVVKFMSAWIVPIMPDKNTFSGILKDFNPMKFEWNWFFWKSKSPFCIFEKVISYMENIKFPEDKRVLLKNVTKTF